MAAVLIVGCSGGSDDKGADRASPPAAPEAPGTWSVAVPASTFGGSAATLSFAAAVTADDGAWKAEVLDPGQPTDSVFTQVVALPGGYYLAAGVVGPDEAGERDLLVGRVDPSGAWSFQVVESRERFSYAVGIAAHERTVVILGLQEVADGFLPTAFVSDDAGVSFREVDAGTFGGARSGALTAVTWQAGAFLALGAAENGTDLAAWSSVDGATWAPVDATIGGQPIRALPTHAASITAPNGNALVAIGAQPRESRYGAYLLTYGIGRTPAWTAEPYPDDLSDTGVVLGAGPLTFTDDGQVTTALDAPAIPSGQGALIGCDGDTDRALVVGTSDDRPVVLSSTASGIAAADLPATRNVAVGGVVRTPKGFVLAGQDSSRFLDRVVVWATTDAATFTAHPQPDDLVGFEGSEYADLTVDGDLVLGGNGPRPIVWAVSDPFG